MEIEINTVKRKFSVKILYQKNLYSLSVIADVN